MRAHGLLTTNLRASKGGLLLEDYSTYMTRWLHPYISILPGATFRLVVKYQIAWNLTHISIAILTS